MSATYNDLRYAQKMLIRMVEKLKSGNSELREEVAQLKAQLDDAEHELSMAADREAHAARREAELRELGIEVSK